MYRVFVVRKSRVFYIEKRRKHLRLADRDCMRTAKVFFFNSFCMLKMAIANLPIKFTLQALFGPAGLLWLK